MYNNDVLRPSFGFTPVYGQSFGGQVFGTPTFGAPVFGAPNFGTPNFATPSYGFGFQGQSVPTGWTGNVAPYGWTAPSWDHGVQHGLHQGLIQQRMDALTGQLAQLTDLVVRGAWGVQPQLPGVNPIHALAQAQAHAQAQAQQAQLGLASGRVRESDSHLFWEVAFPGLSMGDLDIEVSGNRVICRTRIPLRNQLRAVGQVELPRGLEIFELPDGRVELNWLVPVTFVGKDVEASWKDGWIQICIPKAEIAHRQTVKITAENGAARKNGSRDMTA